MFVHPNQLGFALRQVPGIARAQAVVTRSENRDLLTLRVVLADGAADREALSNGVGVAVQSACRVKVDQVEFIPASALEEDAPTIVDERSWE
jgi:phenylacetate-coenzyme A ligase PaaK-like adenylate-forming protein